MYMPAPTVSSSSKSNGRAWPSHICTHMLSHSIGLGPVCLLHLRINSKAERVVQHKLPAPLAPLPTIFSSVQLVHCWDTLSSALSYDSCLATLL